MQLDTTTLINEKVLYDILKCLANAKAPIVFKGALLTKLLIKDNKYNIERATQDLDADWNGELLTINELENYLNNILSDLDNISLKSFRNYGEGKSAGFYVMQNGKNLASFDLDMRKNNFYKLYEIDGVNFYGSSIDKIYADKIYVLSTNLVFRRTKDLIDLYALCSIANIETEKILEIISYRGKDMGNFDALYNRKDEIEHAYSLLKRVTNKPSFEDVYKCCIEIADKFTRKP